MSAPSDHVPVLVAETVAALVTGAAVDDGVFVDATFGRGGHARALLDALGPRARLVAIDRDPAAAVAARAFEDDPRFSFVAAPFSRIAGILDDAGITGVSGVLADLGVSSPQLDDPARGFSFAHDGPLDMRMDTRTGQTAAEWLATVSERDLADTIYYYGEERFSRRIAAAIVAARAGTPIETTAALAEIVTRAVPRREKKKHPATRTFQALRIAINAELKELEALLAAVPPRLVVGGRLAIVSFHSLEDRQVKLGFRDLVRGHEALARRPEFRTVGRLVTPSDAETAINPRARSSRLRVLERTA